MSVESLIGERVEDEGFSSNQLNKIGRLRRFDLIVVTHVYWTRREVFLFFFQWSNDFRTFSTRLTKDELGEQPLSVGPLGRLFPHLCTVTGTLWARYSQT